MALKYSLFAICSKNLCRQSVVNSVAPYSAMPDEDEEETLKPKTETKHFISGRQWMILTVLMFVTMTSSFAVCLFPPFFPRIAEEKGASATIYGFIIGTNCLTSFIITPIIGKHLKWIGVRFSLVSGMFMGGCCCSLAGFLEFFSPGIEFVILAICIRVVHAIANALVILATFTFTAMEFPNSVGKIFSLTRTAMNLAQLFGPVIGGAIYMQGGFYVPFVVMGTLQVIFSIIALPIMPEIRDSKEVGGGGGHVIESKKLSIGNMLKISTIWFSLLTFVIATMCNGFLSINLEPQVLRHFELTPLYIGILFGLKDGANSIASPIWGALCDRNNKRTVKPYLIINALLVSISFLMLGASKVFGIEFNLTMPLLVVALCINGIGIGGEQVTGVVDALHEAVNAGYPDDPNMHGIVAGLWSSFSSAGRFISRAGSGILVDTIGFHFTASVATFLQLSIAIIIFVYIIYYECVGRKTKPCLDLIDDINISSRGTEVFTVNSSPSESAMDKCIYIPVLSSERQRHSSNEEITQLSCSVISEL